MKAPVTTFKIYMHTSVNSIQGWHLNRLHRWSYTESILRIGHKSQLTEGSWQTLQKLAFYQKKKRHKEAAPLINNCLVWREFKRRPLTDDLSDGHGLWECPGLATAARVYGHHADVKQVSSRQVLDAKEVCLGRLLVCHNPVCCCEANKYPCYSEFIYFLLITDIDHPFSWCGKWFITCWH